MLPAIRIQTGFARAAPCIWLGITGHCCEHGGGRAGAPRGRSARFCLTYRCAGLKMRAFNRNRHAQPRAPASWIVGFGVINAAFSRIPTANANVGTADAITAIMSCAGMQCAISAVLLLLRIVSVYAAIAVRFTASSVDAGRFHLWQCGACRLKHSSNVWTLGLTVISVVFTVIHMLIADAARVDKYTPELRDVAASSDPQLRYAFSQWSCSLRLRWMAPERMRRVHRIAVLCVLNVASSHTLTACVAAPHAV